MNPAGRGPRRGQPAMNAQRLRWLAPLLAGWVMLWQACVGSLAAVAPAPVPKHACCSARMATAGEGCCHKACCAAPARRGSQEVPAVPAAFSGSSLPDWIPVLVSEFLHPLCVSRPVSEVAPADAASGTASMPLFRRFCALLI